MRKLARVIGSLLALSPETGLTMTVSGTDGSRLTFVFPLAAVDLATLPKAQMLTDGIAKWTARRPGAIALVNHFN